MPAFFLTIVWGVKGGDSISSGGGRKEAWNTHNKTKTRKTNVRSTSNISHIDYFAFEPAFDYSGLPPSKNNQRYSPSIPKQQPNKKLTILLHLNAFGRKRAECFMHYCTLNVPLPPNIQHKQHLHNAR